MSNMVPFRSNRGLNRNSSSVFDSFFAPFWDTSNFFAPTGFRVDVKDDGDKYLLEAELPGIDQDKIDLSIEQNILTIAANMEKETREEKQNYLYQERRYGQYRRSFSLDGIDQESIEASYKNGVLQVSLPKEAGNEKSNRRRIDIH